MFAIYLIYTFYGHKRKKQIFKINLSNAYKSCLKLIVFSFAFLVYSVSYMLLNVAEKYRAKHQTTIIKTMQKMMYLDWIDWYCLIFCIVNNFFWSISSALFLQNHRQGAFDRIIFLEMFDDFQIFKACFFKRSFYLTNSWETCSHPIQVK